MLCISRITDEKFAQRFGDGKHNFHLEFRCNLPCLTGQDICSKCTEKSPTYKTHGSRKFDHGKVNEPIPDNSHIFGGQWYQARVKTYGEPPSEIIQIAMQYRDEAQKGYTVVQPITTSEKNVSGNKSTTQTISSNASKATKQTTEQEQSDMPRPKKDPNAPPTKRGKPKIGNIQTVTEEIVITDTITSVPAASTVTEAPKKRGGRKKASEENTPDDTPAKTPKKRAPAKKKQSIESINNPIINPESINIKEVIIPTHIEETTEEYDIGDLEIVYVKLTHFEHNGKSYLRDSNKNKLFQVVKGKPGKYIGRFYPETDEIDYDIPDSDNEDEDNE
jgi:hypothetical protein